MRLVGRAGLLVVSGASAVANLAMVGSGSPLRSIPKGAHLAQRALGEVWSSPRLVLRMAWQQPRRFARGEYVSPLAGPRPRAIAW